MIDRRSLILSGAAGAALLPLPAFARRPAEGWVSVRDFGAKGDGTTIDTPAINKAIEHAAARGGGTVWFPPGTYACFTIRLKSNITVHLDNGATILGARRPRTAAADTTSPSRWTRRSRASRTSATAIGRTA
ncbi:MAG: glycosyl hydrolase family 28-related protein [Sphingomonas sp.]